LITVAIITYCHYHYLPEEAKHGFAQIMEILYEARNDVNDVNEFGYNSAESEPI